MKVSQNGRIMPIEKPMSLDEIREAYEGNEYGAGANFLIQHLLAHAFRVDSALHNLALEYKEWEQAAFYHGDQASGYIYRGFIESIGTIRGQQFSTANPDSTAPAAASNDKAAQSDG